MRHRVEGLGVTTPTRCDTQGRLFFFFVSHAANVFTLVQKSAIRQHARRLHDGDTTTGMIVERILLHGTGECGGSAVFAFAFDLRHRFSFIAPATLPDWEHKYTSVSRGFHSSFPGGEVLFDLVAVLF